MKNRFLVACNESPRVDGYYARKEIADGAAEVWRKRFPQWTFQVVNEDRGYLPDSVMLNRLHEACVIFGMPVAENPQCMEWGCCPGLPCQQWATREANNHTPTRTIQ